ncbi:unnamed protein product [Nezara viridula]|uniref:Zinc finger CCCH domain-containing protein 14 n=1 Tax=Nezara viridula TaxID=85310 RepID=A0A9P0DZS6_NEZVI|nr:unnamed protein product [Nezara viridula]
MELGDEVSVKIKSAIRARLKELGIVWDRELPDYVMVLIANKKSREQMENDLTIFLGSHTAGFTAWLHNVLKKLEECTTYWGLTKKKEEEKKSKSKRRPSDENHQETKKLKGIDFKSDDNIGDATSNSGSEDAISNHLSPDMTLSLSVNHSNNIEKLDTNLNHTEKKTLEESSEHQSRLEKEDTARVVERPKPKEKIEISWSGESTIDPLHSSPVKKNSSKVNIERNQSRSKSRSRINNQQGFDQGDHVSVLKRTFMKENLRKEEEKRPYRDSRGIFRRKNSEERRNGYDMNSRTIGKIRSEKDRNLRNRSRSSDMEVDKLPSLVKVTPRPVRHPAMQPSSNLILKAVAEAQKSIATSSLPQPDDKETSRRSLEEICKDRRSDPFYQKMKFRNVKMLPIQEEPVSHLNGAKALNTAYRYIVQENVPQEIQKVVKALRDEAVRKAKPTILGSA